MLHARRIISQDFQNLGLCDSVSQLGGADCHNCGLRKLFCTGALFCAPIRVRTIGRRTVPGTRYKEKFIFDRRRRFG
jgi:hypothetical protein